MDKTLNRYLKKEQTEDY